MLGTGAVWVFPQPLLPQMLAGFLDPTLGLIVTLLGPMQTAIYLGACSAEVTSVLPKQPRRQVWCPMGSASWAVYRVDCAPHSSVSGSLLGLARSRAHQLVNI